MLGAFLLVAALQVAPAEMSSSAAPVERTRPWVNPYGRCERVKVVPAKDDQTPSKPPRGSARAPKAQYAVIRMIDGCGVSTPMR